MIRESKSFSKQQKYAKRTSILKKIMHSIKAMTLPEKRIEWPEPKLDVLDLKAQFKALGEMIEKANQ